MIVARRLCAALAACAVVLGAVAGVAALAADIGLADHRREAGVESPMFGKIVVVGIIRDPLTRRRFEDHFVSLLRGRSFEGITSYSLVPDLANVPDPDKVAETVLADEVDGVFIVRLTPLDDGDAEKSWPAAWRAELDKPSGRVRDYVGASMQRPVVEAKRYGAEVSVWDVASGRRLWAGRFSPLKKKELLKYAGPMSQEAMNQLIYEKLF